MNYVDFKHGATMKIKNLWFQQMHIDMKHISMLLTAPLMRTP